MNTLNQLNESNQLNLWMNEWMNESINPSINQVNWTNEWMNESMNQWINPLNPLYPYPLVQSMNQPMSQSMSQRINQWIKWMHWIQWIHRINCMIQLNQLNHTIELIESYDWIDWINWICRWIAYNGFTYNGLFIIISPNIIHLCYKFRKKSRTMVDKLSYWRHLIGPRFKIFSNRGGKILLLYSRHRCAVWKICYCMS